MSFRSYIADTLKCISENIAQMFGGTAPGKRWAEILDEAEKPADTREPEEILADIAARAGLTIVE